MGRAQGLIMNYFYAPMVYGSMSSIAELAWPHLGMERVLN